MRTIVFLDVHESGSSREAVRAAERLGFYTVVLTERHWHWQQRPQYPDVHVMIRCDLGHHRQLRDHIRNLQQKGFLIASIISFVEPHCSTASLLAEEFGVGCFSSQAIITMQDKILSRLKIEPLSFAPQFTVIRGNTPYTSLPQQLQNRFPLIMKSPRSTGSKDVFKVMSEDHFASLSIELSGKYPQQPILIEEFLDGPQYLVEVVVYQKEIHIIAVFQQEISFQQRFIVTGYSLLLNPPLPFFASLQAAAEGIVKAHGMEMGTCHLELRHVHNQWKLIEINPRISGGGMNRLIEYGLGINLVQETLKMALGQKPDLQPKKQRPVYAQYVTVSHPGFLESVRGRQQSLTCPGVLEVSIKPRKGALLTPPLSMGQRYAYVMATGENEENAKENARQAASHIRFHLQITEEILASEALIAGHIQCVLPTTRFLAVAGADTGLDIPYKY